MILDVDSAGAAMRRRIEKGANIPCEPVTVIGRRKEQGKNAFVPLDLYREGRSFSEDVRHCISCHKPGDLPAEDTCHEVWHCVSLSLPFNGGSVWTPFA